MVLFSGLIFMTDKMSSGFRLALTIVNMAVIIACVVFLVAFVMLDFAPVYFQKLTKYWAGGDAP